MTHAIVPEAERRARGITAGLIRLSVGLEGANVLIEHLDRALRGFDPDFDPAGGI
jgi:cystathionine beta-lyase/cystathionine gamma-synthase